MLLIDSVASLYPPRSENGLVEDLDLPAVPFGVADVHPGQVGGEQRGLLAALTRLDLEHDVVGIVRVARGEQVGELVFSSSLDRGFELGDLGGEGRIVGGQFAGGVQIVAGGLELAVGRMIGASSANRLPTLRASAGSLCSAGSDSWRLQAGVFGQDVVDGDGP